MPQNKDSLFNTFVVATALCLGCAALVSSAAVALRSTQEANMLLDKRTNILKVCGFTDEEIEAAGGVNPLFEKRFTTMIIDLDTGEEALEDAQEALSQVGKKFEPFLTSYDQQWCSKSKESEVATKLDKKADICGIKYREKFSHVFVMHPNGSDKPEKYVFPVRSYGLWSMMQGYLAIEPDLQTVAGITFYDQKETPGLGGEIVSDDFQSLWPGKKIYEGDSVALEVKKAADSEDPHEIDALTGATITSSGVSNLIEFWMGDDGFGPFIENQKVGSRNAATVDDSSTDNVSFNVGEAANSNDSTPASPGDHHG